MTELALAVWAMLKVPGYGRSKVWTSLIQNGWKRNQTSEYDLVADQLIREHILVRPEGRSLLDTATREIEAWGQDTFDPLWFFDPDYPSQLYRALGKQSPLILFSEGNRELLREIGVGFCGSRDATNLAMEVASQCAGSLGKLGFVATAGNARGIDEQVHMTALSANSSTIFVVPEGLAGFRLKSLYREWANESNHLVISEFNPKSKWSVQNAMQRNKTIAGLSQALIVIQAKPKGGSLEAGRDCLRMKLPCFTMDISEDSEAFGGNHELISLGATPLKMQGDKLDVDSFESLMSSTEKLKLFYRSVKGQMNLFD